MSPTIHIWLPGNILDVSQTYLYNVWGIPPALPMDDDENIRRDAWKGSRTEHTWLISKWNCGQGRNMRWIFACLLVKWGFGDTKNGQCPVATTSGLARRNIFISIYYDLLETLTAWDYLFTWLRLLTCGLEGYKTNQTLQDNATLNSLHHNTLYPPTNCPSTWELLGYKWS